MPIMDGFQATNVIRNMPEPYCSLPIVALTANVLTSDREKSLELGLNEHLTKPIEQEDLITVLSLWLKPAKQREHKTASIEKGNITIEGIDLDDCYKRLNNNQMIVRKVFNLFADQYKNIDQLINSKAHDQDWEAVSSLAHSLKGNAANISAIKLANIASSIEEGVKERPHNELNSQLPELSAELAVVLKAIETHISINH